QSKSDEYLGDYSMFLKVGVRADKLSLARGDLAIRTIRETYPSAQVERKILHGLKDPTKQSMTKLRGPKRTFDNLLASAVADGKVDLAVFNMKDLPFLKNGGPLLLAATPARSSPYEALVSRGPRELENLRSGATVGTSTLFRIAQLRRVRPDLRPQPIGGKVEDRIFRLDRGEVDALIIAESGLAQLGMTERITQRLPLTTFLPTPCQGITAIVTQRENQRAIEAVRAIDDKATRAEAEAERGLETILRADCNVPLGCYSRLKGDRLELTASVLSPDGETMFRASSIGLLDQTLALANSVSDSLISQGARSLEEGWRRLYPLEDD
ncbi:MAG TPA: hydroxymethylbilane synthase, partial [Candidatus Binatus sp.]|nr:hydroxymethylbilane synthase [Candidatus Binatus sp.]